jgi:hypothetical protein
VDIKRSLNGGGFSNLETNISNAHAYTDNTGLKGGQTLGYRVCSTPAGEPTVCSNTVEVVF